MRAKRIIAALLCIVLIATMFAGCGKKSGKLDDGQYTIEIKLEGGSGRVTLKSPAAVTVKNGEITLQVEWSSKNYDYMIVNGVKYYPVNDSGNSVFEFPVTSLEGELPVIGDTIAMSTPHEIEYKIVFDRSTLK